jgi:hypothetical protein
MSADLLGMKIKKQEFMLRRFKGDPPNEGKIPIQQITFGDDQDTIITDFDESGVPVAQQVIPHDYPLSFQEIVSQL